MAWNDLSSGLRWIVGSMVNYYRALGFEIRLIKRNSLGISGNEVTEVLHAGNTALSASFDRPQLI